MSRRARTATSLLSLAVIGVIAALLAIGVQSSTAQPQCGVAAGVTYSGADLAVARRISYGEVAGAAVKRALRTISSDRVLAAAVAGDDLAAVRAEMLVLLFNHEHIVRLRVSRAGRVLLDIGGPLVLAPVGGTLRLGGRTVGTFLMSIQDDNGYRLLTARLIGAHTVIAYDGATIMRDIRTPRAALPAQGAVVIAGARYLVSSLTMGHFPSGVLHVSLLVHEPPAELLRGTCSQVRAQALAYIARRVYDAAGTGPSAQLARTALEHSSALGAALAAGADSQVPGIARSVRAAGEIARLQVLAGNRVVADTGTRIALLDPLAMTIVDAAGARVGRALFAVQNAHGYADLVHDLTRAAVLVRRNGQRVAGTFAGPAVLPSSGPLTYRGVRYSVASFAGTAFPSGRLEIYVLAPA